MQNSKVGVLSHVELRRNLLAVSSDSCSREVEVELVLVHLHLVASSVRMNVLSDSLVRFVFV